MRIQSVTLEYHRDISVLRLNIVHQLTVDVKFALADFFKTCDHTERCRFTASRWTYEDDELFVFDLEVEVLNCVKAVRIDFVKFIKNRILSFSIILVFAFILLITFTITNIIGELSQKFIFKYPEAADSLVKVVGIIINMSVTTIIFTLIFKILPDAKIKSKDVCIGAVVTTILLLIGQWGISFYIGIANVGTVYGAAAFMVVFVTWIYYSSIIIYTGAEFTKAWANEMGSKIFPDEYAVATKTIEIHEDKPIE